MSATKRPVKKSQPDITAQEALDILASAVSYCQQAGLTVRAGNRPQLTVAIDGAHLTADGAFCADDVTLVTLSGN